MDVNLFSNLHLRLRTTILVIPPFNYPFCIRNEHFRTNLAFFGSPLLSFRPRKLGIKASKVQWSDMFKFLLPHFRFLTSMLQNFENQNHNSQRNISFTVSPSTPRKSKTGNYNGQRNPSVTGLYFNHCSITGLGVITE